MHELSLCKYYIFEHGAINYGCGCRISPALPLGLYYVWLYVLKKTRYFDIGPEFPVLDPVKDDSLYDITGRKPEARQGIDNLTVWEEAGGTGRVYPWGDSMP